MLWCYSTIMYYTFYHSINAFVIEALPVMFCIQTSCISLFHHHPTFTYAMASFILLSNQSLIFMLMSSSSLKRARAHHYTASLPRVNRSNVSLWLIVYNMLFHIARTLKRGYGVCICFDMKCTQNSD